MNQCTYNSYGLRKLSQQVVLTGLDEILQNSMGNILPFGREHLIIGSDFGQNLLIVEKGRIAEHYDICIKNLVF